MAQNEPQEQTVRDQGIALLVAVATLQLGPLGGLAVRLGAPLALDAVARPRGRPATNVDDPEVRATARVLLELPTFGEVAAAAEEAAKAKG